MKKKEKGLLVVMLSRDVQHHACPKHGKANNVMVLILYTTATSQKYNGAIKDKEQGEHAHVMPMLVLKGFELTIFPDSLNYCVFSNFVIGSVNMIF